MGVLLRYYKKLQKCSIKVFSSSNSKIETDKSQVDKNQLNRYKVAAKKLDQYLKDKGFNGTALVTSKNHVILRKGYGYGNVIDKVLATPETKYRIGSITKTVVAISILQLRERGKLNIEDMDLAFIIIQIIIIIMVY